MNDSAYRKLSIALSVALLGTTVFALPAPAQVRAMPGGRGPAPAPSTGRGRPIRPGTGKGLVGRGLRSRGSYNGWLPYGFYPDYDYGYGPDYGYGYEPGPSQAPPPEAFAQPPSPQPPPLEPLVIERRGDQWVRVATYAEASTQAAPAPLAATPLSASPERTEPTGRAVELPPAVLVFRDGHKEEVQAYTIIGSVIYTSSDYWSTGSWTKQVPIAQLDVPATVQQNRERGGKFSLPSGPNEITMRP